MSNLKTYEQEKIDETYDDSDDQELYNNETEYERRNEIMGSYDDQAEDPFVTDENGKRIYI